MAGANRLFKHFSHPHMLELSTFQSPQGLTNSPTLCSCCKRAPSGEIYICRPCNFILHLWCSQIPKYITLAAHCNHTLTLLPTAAYTTGLFWCNACGKPGNGFNYHCSSCSYDLHAICAYMPFYFTHQSHACPLSLTFRDPLATNFFCNICGEYIGSSNWRYRCSACNFDVHLGCCWNKASPTRSMVGGSHAQGQLQPQRSIGLGIALARRIAEHVRLLGEAIFGFGSGLDHYSYAQDYDYVDSSSIWDSLSSVFGF